MSNAATPAAMNKRHTLKTLPGFYEQVVAGNKKFECRINDRDFQVGDVLELAEFDPLNNGFTGRYLVRQVTYILRGPMFGVKKGWCVMSI